MVEPKLKLDTGNTNASVSIEGCFAKVTEVHKAALTINMALVVATVTITGYAVQLKKIEFFLLAAIVPIFALIFDIFMKYKYAAPYLYKAATLDIESLDSEPTSLLILDYGKGRDSKYMEILNLPSGSERQKTFRRYYIKTEVWPQLFLVVPAVICEIFLAFHFR